MFRFRTLTSLYTLLQLVQRMVVYHLTTNTPLTNSFDTNQLLNVLARLFAYLSRDAVWNANVPKAYHLAALTSATLSALVIFGTAPSVLSPHVQWSEIEKKALAARGGTRDLTYPMLLYEVARCGCNNVFHKTLVHAQAQILKKKKLLSVPLCSKCTRPLTFENLCLLGDRRPLPKEAAAAARKAAAAAARKWATLQLCFNNMARAVGGVSGGDFGGGWWDPGRSRC